MAENESGTALCQKCGNIGRFNVVVTHPRVDGQWCRVSCSRVCGEMLVKDGCRELGAQVGWAGECRWSMAPILTGNDPSIRVK